MIHSANHQTQSYRKMAWLHLILSIYIDANVTFPMISNRFECAENQSATIKFNPMQIVYSKFPIGVNVILRMCMFQGGFSSLATSISFYFIFSLFVLFHVETINKVAIGKWSIFVVNVPCNLNRIYHGLHKFFNIYRHHTIH